MSYLLVWIPTFVAVLILMIAALLLDLSTRRDERRKTSTSSLDSTGRAAP